jgi:O-antigen/teichoic acid export membrane protein
MIAFAWPGLIGGLAFYAINLADRFFVLHFHGTSDNGLYEAAFRYSQFVLVGVFAFRLGWPQWHYSWFRTGRHEQMVARGANYYFFGAGFLAVFVSLWILPLFHVLMPERYWPATEALPPLALGAVATGAYTLFAVGLNVTKRMRLLPPLALVGAAIAMGLNFLLIPPYSYVGAAWATAAAFWALAFIVFFVSNRIYPVPWQWPRLLLVLAATVGLALSALAVDAWLPMTVSLPVRLALTLAYPLLLVGFGFFSRDDLEKARRLILRRDRARPA